jgi:hypothetical protein
MRQMAMLIRMPLDVPSNSHPIDVAEPGCVYSKISYERLSISRILNVVPAGERKLCNIYF